MNVTCDRLRGLRSGHSLCYYRGRLDEDIGRSAGVLKYRDLLQTVRETAITLEKAGQLVLSTRSAIVEFIAVLPNGDKVAHRIPIVEYLAVGR
jgi:hypothetical protein